MTWRAIVGGGVVCWLCACNQVEPLDAGDSDGAGDALPPQVAAAFTRSCGTEAGCHVAGGLEPLLANPSADALLAGGLVTRGDLQGSRIAVKMLGLPGLTGGIMPPPNNPADPADLSLILAWIAGLDSEGSATSGGSSGDGSTDDGTPMPEPDDCLEGAELSSPPTITELWPMLEASCTSGVDGCHFSQAPVMSDAAAAHTNLIDVMSAGGLVYVTPGAPDDSYLWHKVVDTHLEVGGDGLRMPLGPPLCAEGVVGLYAWILGGAAQ